MQSGPIPSNLYGGPSPNRPYVVPPNLNDADLFGSAPNPAANSAPDSSITRPNPNYSVNQPNNRYASSIGDLTDDDLPKSSALNAALSATALSFFSTAMVMPFDVGKTLLQVQFIPKTNAEALENESERDFGAEDDELSDENEAEAYFADITSRSAGPPLRLSPSNRVRDSVGYIARLCALDETTKPEYTLPLIVTGGVGDMMRALWKFRPEGFSALWKGQMVSFLIDTISDVIQPIFHSIVISAAPAESLPALPLVHSPHPTFPLVLSVSAHVLTGLVLSPLDLVRTRIIVQSTQSRHRKYSGIFNALSTINEEEGGARGLCYHANLILPTILDHTVRALVHLGTPLIIERFLGIGAIERPIPYCLAEFVLNSLGLVFILPIETVRRRLQLQSRAELTSSNHKPYKACVEIRPVPYAGIVEAIYRIITEETSSVPPRLTTSGRRRSGAQQDREATSFGHIRPSSGTRQLFKGLGLGIGANGIVFLLKLVTGPDEGRAGWAEM